MPDLEVHSVRSVRPPIPASLITEETEDCRTKPRILMVGMHLTATRGGITTLTAGMLASPLRDRFEIRYIASQAEDYGRFRKFLLAAYSLIHFFVRAVGRPDVAYIHVGSNASLYRESAFIAAARALGLPVLTHFHAGDIAEYMRRQPGWGKRSISWALGLSNKVIAVSEESANQVRRFVPGADITIIPNSIRLDARSRTRDLSKKDKDHPKILFVGAVGKLKGENDLIAALGELKKRGVGFEAAFLGHGAESLRASCRELGISEKISHLGPVAMDERLDFFADADIFVLPTYAEAMPMSVIEAMAAGLAIVTTPVGGIPEQITDGDEGLFFSPGDVEDLADKLTTLINDPALRQQLGRRARQRYIEQSDHDSFLKNIEQAALEVCRKSP